MFFAAKNGQKHLAESSKSIHRYKRLMYYAHERVWEKLRMQRVVFLQARIVAGRGRFSSVQFARINVVLSASTSGPRHSN